MLNLHFKLYLTRPISLALPSSSFTLSRFLLLCVPFRALFSIALLTSKLVVLHCTEDRDRYVKLNYFVVVEVGLSIGVLVVVVSLYQVQANTTSRYVLKSLKLQAERDFRRSTRGTDYNVRHHKNSSSSRQHKSDWEPNYG
ncbi:hypothetical protein GmHk_02G004231 [Glycine max]|nr:hypothetical protein GmHk_02G004231 [Glycine max]